MIRRISLLAALLALSVLLAACTGTQQASDPDHITLTVMGKRTDLEKSYMTGIFDLYEKATGNELRIIAYEDSEFELAAAGQFAQGNVPDVFLHFHNADLSRFDIAGNFYMLNEEDWADDLTDSARAYCQNAEGDLLGLPFWESSVSGCYYNKTILDGLGLKPANTQAEFDMLCQALADIDYTPICWPANGCTWMFQFGLDPVFADDPALLEALNGNEMTYADIPAVEDMARWITDAAQKGWFGPDYLDTGWGEISAALSSHDFHLGHVVLYGFRGGRSVHKGRFRPDARVHEYGRQRLLRGRQPQYDDGQQEQPPPGNGTGVSALLRHAGKL